MPLKVSKVITNNNGIVFFNTFRGSKIQECASLNFKLNDHADLSIVQVQENDSGAYEVQGCMKWLEGSENLQTRYGETKKLRESILYDWSNHILLTIWEKLLKMNLKESTHWCLKTSTSKINLAVK